MLVITKISTQKNNSDRFNLYVNEKFTCGVDADVLVKFNLQKGKEISKLELSEIMYADECQKAFNQAIVYLSYRMRAESEIRTYLKQKDVGQAVIDEVVHRLHRQKYLDDQEFANAYVRTQVNGGKKGPNVIKQELKQKKINDQYIDEALTFYPESKQIEHAIHLGEKLVKQQKKLSEKILKQKMEQTLMIKGFPYSIISIVMEEIEYERDGDEEWDALVIQFEKADRKFRSLQGYEYKMKVKNFLYRKGFPLELIDQLLAEKEEA